MRRGFLFHLFTWSPVHLLILCLLAGCGEVGVSFREMPNERRIEGAALLTWTPVGKDVKPIEKRELWVVGE